MGESLWVDFDEYLKEYLIEQLGPDSDYEDLQVQDVFVTILREISDWKSWSLPAIAIMGKDIIRNNDEFGDGDLHYAKTMPYIIAIATEGDQESCVRDAKIIEHRLEQALIALRVNLSSDSEEVMDIVEMSNTRVAQYRKMSDGSKPTTKKSTSTKDWYGVAAVRIIASSTV